MNEGPHIQVTLVDEQTVSVDEGRIADVAKRTAAAEGAIGEISITLVDTARIIELNKQHMGEDGPTDVLSFPVDGLVTSPQGDIPVLVGEIALCPEVALKAPADAASEIDLLVAHGVLHLLGFDHDSEEAAAQMREREMASVGRAGASAS